MKGGNRGLRLLLRLRRCFEVGDVKVDEKTRRDVIAGLTELFIEAQALPDRRYYDAMRMEIVRLEELAKKTLHANPFSKEADEAEEVKWRELAHASRQLRPLFDAWVKADEPNSESAQYKYGFHFRLMESMTTVAEVAEYGRLHRLKQRKWGGKDRPKSKSPFTQFIVNHLKRNPLASAKEIKDLLIDDAREGKSGEFQLSNDKLTFLTIEDRPKRLKISGIPAAVAKAKKKLPRK